MSSSPGSLAGAALSQAVVNVVPIPPDTDFGSYIGTDTDPGVYADYRIQHRYVRNPDIRMNGVTSPNGFAGASVAFMQLSAPTLLWIADWTCCHSAEQPLAPDPAPQDSNWVLLYVMPETAMVTVGPDGFTPLYRLSGLYVYGHKNPSANVFNNINFARPPWLADVYDRSMPNKRLQPNLIGGFGSVSTGGGGSSSISPGNPGTFGITG